MIKIAITGSIASGKTLVEEILQQQGVLVVDTDKIVHDLLENDELIINKVYELFITDGINVKTETGSIDRKKVGEIVFSDSQKLKKLEAIIHPEVKKIVQGIFDKNQDKEIIAVSAPLLYEANMQNMFDFVIMLTADEKIKLERLMKSRGLSQEEALKRIKSQDFGEEKLKKADFVVENNKTVESLKLKVYNLLKEIKEKI